MIADLIELCGDRLANYYFQPGSLSRYDIRVLVVYVDTFLWIRRQMV